MSEYRRAVRALYSHLEEVIGVSEATAVVVRVDQCVTEEYLDRKLRELNQQLHGEMEQVRIELTGTLAAAWRRDLLLISVGQFFALAAAVAALVTFG